MRADLILKSNNIFTSTSDKPISGGVAIKGNKLLAVGEDFEAFLGPETEVREYGDKLIMPGFIDAHVHYFMAGLAARMIRSDFCIPDVISSSLENPVVIPVRPPSICSALSMMARFSTSTSRI